MPPPPQGPPGSYRSRYDHGQQGGVVDADHPDRETAVRLAPMAQAHRGPGVIVALAMPGAPASHQHHDHQRHGRQSKRPGRVSHRNRRGKRWSLPIGSRALAGPGCPAPAPVAGSGRGVGKAAPSRHSPMPNPGSTSSALPAGTSSCGPPAPAAAVGLWPATRRHDPWPDFRSGKARNSPCQYCAPVECEVPANNSERGFSRLVRSNSIWISAVCVLSRLWWTPGRSRPPPTRWVTPPPP